MVSVPVVLAVVVGVTVLSYAAVYAFGQGRFDADENGDTRLILEPASQATRRWIALAVGLVGVALMAAILVGGR